MARFVVLYFPDNDIADDYVKVHTERKDVFQGDVMYDFQVTGLFGIPTQFCECPPERDKKIARGAKMGWWVHRDCGKPVRDSWQSPRNLLTAQSDPREADPEVKPSWTFLARNHRASVDTAKQT